MTSRRIRVTIITSACLFLFGSCRDEPFGPSVRSRIVQSIGRVLSGKTYAGATDFTSWPDLAREHTRTVDGAITPDGYAAVLNKALATYGVSHLSVMSPAEAAARTKGSRVGIGAVLMAVPDGLVVTAMAPDGPAGRAGLRPGDVIVDVDGAAARDPAQVDGPDGSSAEIRWQRGGTTREAAVVLRQTPATPPDGLRWLRDRIAVISVHSFVDGRYDRKRIDEFFSLAGGARALVLDLRSNAGGNADNVRHLLGHLLPAGTPILADVYREDADRYRRRHPGRPTDAPSIARALERDYTPIAAAKPFARPLAVLVDGRSASGGELAPAVLQEHRRGVLVGSPTRGKVRIGEMFDLPGGFVLQAPIGEFVTSGGRVVEDNPVVPDVRLTPSETARDSLVFARALEKLTD